MYYTRMTCYSEVCIWWTLYYPIRQWENICEWHWSNPTDTSHIIDVTSRLYLYYTFILYKIYFFNYREVIIQKSPHSESMPFRTQTIMHRLTFCLECKHRHKQWKCAVNIYISTLGMPLDQSAFKDLSSYTIYSWLGKVNTYHNLCYFFIYKVIKINHYQIKSEPKHNHQQFWCMQLREHRGHHPKVT